MLRYALPALALFMALGAHASSPKAWADDDARIQKACRAASGLADVKPVGRIIRYDDRIPVSALVLEGRYPQKHMAGKTGRELCVFERKTGTASVSEADQLLP
ncbi:hypothetical protein EC912_104397 [Luteibacter rhizovicinus]|uniref:Uncharacterized protein n=1 Tax=Luteibacter rhizovicinus TaxID=242606 RepID=A0A4V2W417_9GAMM|nr:hypothetical protein [Luteibacter rhizovicinus]TCV94199.1 hypothetical protein EC912_104397 [Luteibacter rhizovicinus]